MADTPTPAAPAAPAPAASPAPADVKKDEKKAAPSEVAPKDAPAPEDDAEDIEEEADAIEDMPEDTKEEKKAKAEAKKKWKLKVAGRDIEADEDELIRRAQMGYSADQKWQEAAQMRKQMDSFIALLQQDPGEALSKLGMNVDELAERHIQRRIEEMQKSPEQLEREKLEKELQKLKKEMEDKENAAREEEIARMQEKFAIEIENDILTTLDKDRDMPKSPYVVKRVADLMIIAMRNGRKDVTAKDVLPIVKKQINDELREMYSVAPDEVFETLVGKDRLTKYRKARVKRKPTEQPPTPLSNQVQQTGQSELKSQSSKEERRQKSARDFFKTLGKK